MPKQVHSAVRRALRGRWPAQHSTVQAKPKISLSHSWHSHLKHDSIVNLPPYLVCFSAQLTV